MARTERDYEVFCGTDVGKRGHQACALDLEGRRLHDKALSNDEAELRAVFARLQAPVTEVQGRRSRARATPNAASAP